MAAYELSNWWSPFLPLRFIPNTWKALLKRATARANRNRATRVLFQVCFQGKATGGQKEAKDIRRQARFTG